MAKTKRFIVFLVTAYDAAGGMDDRIFNSNSYKKAREFIKECSERRAEGVYMTYKGGNYFTIFDLERDKEVYSIKI